MVARYKGKLKALLIDMDGTLADSGEMLLLAYQSFLKQFGVTGSLDEFRSLIGPSLPEIVKYLKKRYSLLEDETSLIDLYLKGVAESYRTHVLLFPFAKETLGFAKAEGISLALVTSAEKDLAEAFVSGASFSSVFDLVVSKEASIPSKPDPALYQQALKRLRVSERECLAIEDSLNGVKAATCAGVFTLWLTHDWMGGKEAPDESLQEGSYLRVNDWRAVFNFLKELKDE